MLPTPLLLIVVSVCGGLGPHLLAAEPAPAPVKPAWASQIGNDSHGHYADVAVQGVAQRLRWIPPGSFRMGDATYGPAHEVTLTQGFWLGDSEVTQALWQVVMGSNPSGFTCDPQRPVEMISWEDGHAFFAKLNAAVPSLDARFPAEAQWEYACRAGTTGDHAGELAAMAWYDVNAKDTTHPVKTKSANAFGLFDMHGNVYEWCADWQSGYSAELQRDPTGPATGRYRIFRGGSWNASADFARSAYRTWNSPGLRWDRTGVRICAPGR